MQHFIPKAITPNRDLKQLGAQWLSDNVRGPHIRSNEITPAIPYLPFRWLPALQFVDKVTGPMREGIALLKGTIVSSINMLEAIDLPAVTPQEGNQRPWGEDQKWAYFVGHDGTVTQIPLEETFYAYGSDVHSLLVPANGGPEAFPAGQTLTYTTRDEDMGRIYPDAAGTLIANGDTLVIPGNFPIGVVMDDIYIDYRGMYLNYQTEGKLLTNVYKQGLIEYPYLDVTEFDVHYGTFAGAVKTALDLKFRYFHAPTAGMINGSKIIPDPVGNPTVYIPSYPTPSLAELITYMNISTYQVVGHLDGLNPKQPHSLNDLHDTMLGSGMTGTDTLGIDADLYWFVYEALRLGGSVSPTRENIKTAIRSGHFGYAHLWFHVK